VCEIQIRSKLQDVWAEITHKIHYGALTGLNLDDEMFIAKFSNQLYSEDRSAAAIRNILQQLPGPKEYEDLTDR